MSTYICPKCDNYTYDCSLPCPKCGFNFKYVKKTILKVKNCTTHTIYYDFSYGAGLSISPNETEIISLKENVILTFYFHITDENNKFIIYRCNFYTKDEKYLDLSLIEENGKYLCRIDS